MSPHRPLAAPPRSGSGFAATMWAALDAEPDEPPPSRFDPATLDALPAPARRYLARALPEGIALARVVELEMQGEIKLGSRWMPFAARQILRGGAGLVWSASAGSRLVRFRGADALALGEARMEFRLHGLIPLVRATGDGVHRSAQGRLAAETVAWLPQRLTPQAGARWTAGDDERATVTIDAAGTDVDIEVAVDPDGRLRWMRLQRWNDSAKPPGYSTFGGAIGSSYTTGDGVRIAGTGSVAWDWNPERPDDGVFFRYEVTNAAFDRVAGEHGATA